MNELVIRTRNGTYEAELDGSDISNEIWLSLPFSNYVNMLGDEIYFCFPLDSAMPKEGLVTVLDKGDIAYWPKVGALCIFFGPTPLSGPDGRPVSRYPVLKIGRLKGDLEGLDSAGDRQKITLDRKGDHITVRP